MKLVIVLIGCSFLPLWAQSKLDGVNVVGSMLIHRGITLPATCTVGQIFFDTDAPSGQNQYGCTATNVWTLLSGGGLPTTSGAGPPSGTLPAGSPYFDTNLGAMWYSEGGGIWRLINTVLDGAGLPSVIAPGGCNATAEASTFYRNTTATTGAIWFCDRDLTWKQLGSGTGTSYAAGPSGAIEINTTPTPDEIDFLPGPGKVYLDAAGVCTDAVGTDSYACSLSPSITSYATGGQYRFVAGTANTGGATVNFNGLGNRTIVKAAGGITTALATNDIRAGQHVVLNYDGTNMQMQSTLGNAASGSFTKMKLPINMPTGSGTVSTAGWGTGWFGTTANSATQGSFNDFGAAGANQQRRAGLNFSAVTVAYVLGAVRIPDTWDASAVTARLGWYMGSGGSNGQSVTWQANTFCLTPTDLTSAPTYTNGTPVTTVMSIGGTLAWDEATLTIPTTGCAANEVLHVQLLRDPTVDTQAATAMLTDVTFYFVVNLQ